MNHTQKFTGRADAYMAARPAYAEALIDLLYSRYGLTDASVIADVGAGTGKLTEQLLKRGNTVYAVEPNDDMRSAATESLKKYPRFALIKGCDVDTHLADTSFDIVTAAQAFHWFDVAGFKAECKRILKRDGLVALIWNSRDMNCALNRDSETVFRQYCPAFAGFGGGIERDDPRIQAFFDGIYDYHTFDNPVFFDRDKFILRCLSGSYSLKKEDAGYPAYADALNRLFDGHQENGTVRMGNQSTLYIGKLR